MSPLTERSLQIKLLSTSLAVDARGLVALPPAGVSLAPGTPLVFPQRIETRAEVLGAVRAEQARRVEQALADAYRWPTPLPATAGAVLDPAATAAPTTRPAGPASVAAAAGRVAWPAGGPGAADRDGLPRPTARPRARDGEMGDRVGPQPAGCGRRRAEGTGVLRAAQPGRPGRRP